MSDFKLDDKSKIKAEQLKFIAKQMAAGLDDNTEEKDIHGLSRYIKDNYAGKIGNPLFMPVKADRYQLPYMEDMTYTMNAITADLNILSDEQQTASLYLKDTFNDIHSEKKRLSNRINSLNHLTSDLLLITGEDNANTVYVKESFERAKTTSQIFSTDTISQADIHTGEGILTLKRQNHQNLSENARINYHTGNGTVGASQIVRKFTDVTDEGQLKQTYRFINTENEKKNTLTENILDGRPDTVFEYQMVNVPEPFKKERRYYDFQWSKSSETGDVLQLKMVVELDEPSIINWITLDPYYANNANGSLLVKSIRTSLNGFDYADIYDGEQVLNQYINNTPQTYRLDDLFTGENSPASGQYSGKGVWSFPHREARFVEFVLEQKQSYAEIIGQAVYYMTTGKSTYPVQVPEPQELAKQPEGKYVRFVDGERIVYEKEVQATTQGWRYAIGIRDIGIMQYQYDEKSHFVSELYDLPEDIERLVLYSREIIPKDYLDIISVNNDWIQYEVSFDDINWTRISPMHHEPLTINFPPKIIEVNTSVVDSTDAFQIHKDKINVINPRQVRFRITISRPAGEQFQHTTPIVEEVALKLQLKGGL